MEIFKTIPVHYTHEATFIPKRGRKVRTCNFGANGYATIRVLGSTDAQLAFRIHTSEVETPPLNPPTFEILAVDGKLWWPLCVTQYTDCSGASSEECLKVLAEPPSGTFDFHIFDERTIDVTTNDIEFRQFHGGNHDQALALYQRKIFENLILCDGRAYALGGEPAYVQHGSDGDCTVYIASLGADRSFDPTLRGLYKPPGRFKESFIQEALWMNRFQKADQYDLAMTFRHERETPDRLAHIEVLMPEMIRANRTEVRLDAIFRGVFYYLTRESYRYPGEAGPALAKLLASLTEVAEQAPDASSTSADRMRAMHEVEKFARDFPRVLWPAFEDLVGYIGQIERMGDFQATKSFTMADDEALAGLDG